ncbi:MAG: chemotaxis protein CheA [Ignavibacteria bacterium]|nr:chemotaxis protein CheA [Ignavibacteria bacterium]MCU7499291.1 chemotaxis protein CheA [Ignavibacteria bacterium]MCU7512520.1 chemotaxis protein CheA [Ignavibacteria bacterium]MCU7519702.1 chemotaxis protein CheA [Ignavibacteria bacterium]MCU7524572.1 chemotaxis protein CheA [Ignavibacteria bacterium]
MLNDPEMQEIFDSFIVETKEILEKLDLELVEIEKTPDDRDLLNSIFRSFHTVKGTSGFLGLEKLTMVTHRAEDILNKLRKGEAHLNDDLMDGILGAFDRIKDLLETIETNHNENIEIDDIIKQLEVLYKELETGKKAEPTAPKPKAAEEEKSSTPEPQKAEAPKAAPAETAIHAKEEEPSTETAAVKAAGTRQQTDNTIRVDVERLDDLLNIVSELVLGRNRLTQVNAEVALEYEGTKLARDMAEASKQIDLMTTELQLAVMKTRMIKIGKVFNRFPRLVRDLAKETKKDIQLVINGEETELDKTLIEEINDPLVHLVRNAVDHGVESPEVRLQKGKDPKGTVTLSAEHEGNNIIITIEDDGKGINTEVLKEKAVSKGLITRERANELSRQEAYNLIFIPGFSTTEVVSNISGRGVGMDVVKTNVAKLRGLINIESEVDRGTKIIIKLPLTLAIIQGLLVKVDSETVVIPLNSVVEVVRVSNEEIKSINQNEVIRIRDSVLPLIRIDKLLYDDTQAASESKWQYVVVVGIAEKRFGLRVDELVGQKEVVIKSLGNYLGNIQGIAGSTIMGDGKVVMIVDVGELINNLTDENC